MINIIIFGGTGDLSTRKLLPALYNLFQAKLITKFSILGLGRRPMSDEKYRKFVEKNIKQFAPCTVKAKNCDAFLQNLSYQAFDVTQPENYELLCAKGNTIYYLAVQPGLVPKIVDNLGKKQLCRHQPKTKIIIEKPFGNDKKSATKLNKQILKEFDEQQIYRIDHYLGKETVQNITFFRFSNNIFEPLWNHNYIDNVQITVAEKLGIGTRGAFYEEAGVIRDMVQNHIMQLISLISMEAPTKFTADLFRDEKVKVLNVIKSDKKEICLGQYASYRKEKNVAAKSKTPTFFAGKFYINNERWNKVPFYVRTGKKLAKQSTVITIEFKQPPLKLFKDICSNMQPNTLNFNIQPQEEIALGFSVKKPGSDNKPYPVDMVFNYANTFKTILTANGLSARRQATSSRSVQVVHEDSELRRQQSRKFIGEEYPAYERLLIDCMKADQTLFARQDGVEATWKIVDPIIKAQKNVTIYANGSCGPEKATQLIERDKRKWHKL